MNNKLFVGNLSYKLTDQELEDFFSQAGKVVSARIVNDRDTGRSKGFAFVEFETEAEAQNAMSTLHDQDLAGRQVKISLARPRQ